MHSRGPCSHATARSLCHSQTVNIVTTLLTKPPSLDSLTHPLTTAGRQPGVILFFLSSCLPFVPITRIVPLPSVHAVSLPPCGPLCIPDTSLANVKGFKSGRAGWPLSLKLSPAQPLHLVSPGQAWAAAEAAGEDDPGHGAGCEPQRGHCSPG